MTRYSLILVTGLLVGCGKPDYPLPIGIYCIGGNPNAEFTTYGALRHGAEGGYNNNVEHRWIAQRVLQSCKEQSHD